MSDVDALLGLRDAYLDRGSSDPATGAAFRVWATVSGLDTRYRKGILTARRDGRVVAALDIWAPPSTPREAIEDEPFPWEVDEP